MIKSYCKINLSLRILKKLKSGLHDIQSNVLLLDLHDSIKITKIKKNKDLIIFKGKFKKFVNRNNNSVSDSLKILRKNKLIDLRKKYKILIKKNIPAFAGLGGGSSNAAFVIKHLIKKKFNRRIIKIFESKIGSDLSLFNNKQTYLKNLITPIKYKRHFNFYFVLVYPAIKSSTRKAYSKVKKYQTRSKINFSNIKSKNHLIQLIKNHEINALQEIVISKFIIIKKILDFISQQEGCHFSRITGSGSVCFGIFKSQKTAISGMKTIKKKFPKYWCVVAKTI
jgi:4-diphosphocytidyl-2-C-methyl-D-erythritol kinase|tara:strand:- start:971 stop:1813 length:843 start_codon:yes stop_codon:yes gene_type:complete